MEKPTPVEEAAEGLLGGIGLEWSAGYDSHYIFRGELLQKNTVWTQLSYDLEINDWLSLNVTPWFLQDVDSDYNEFDLTAGLTAAVADFEFTLGYAGYWYPRGSWGDGEGDDDEQEMSLGVSRSFGPLSVGLLGVYNFNRDGYYYEATLGYELEVSDALTLTPAVVAGWDTDYYAEGTGWNHAGVMLTADWSVTHWLTVSPYIAGNFASGHLEDRDDVYGGVRVAITF